jgi:hypothetical protein
VISLSRLARTAVAGAAVAVAACGSGGGDALSQAQDGLAKLHSGTLSVRLDIEPVGVTDGKIGFLLSGPFSLDAGKALPPMRLAYTQIAGARRAAVTLVSDGRQAWVQTRGTTYRLTAAQTAPLRQVSRSNGGLHALGIDFDRWVRDPKVKDGPEVDGVSTQEISGAVDIVRALDDLLSAGRRGGVSPGLSDAAKRSLARSVTRSHADVIAGRDDHIPRRIVLDVEFAVSGQARQLLGGLRGATAHLSVGISHANSPVRVVPPPEAATAAPLPSS